MNANNRIIELIEKLGITQKEFADTIHLKPSTMSLIVNNKRNVTQRVINDICREYNVQEEWLTNGTGDIFCSDTPDFLDGLIKAYHLTEKDSEILKSYLQMSETNRELFYNFVKSFQIPSNNEKE